MMMMDLLTAQASASRRAFSIRPLSRHTFGHFTGDVPSSDVLNGRPGDEYVACYPMKKSRSHTSMVQTTESTLEADECGYVVTSAPDNAFCVMDFAGDGDADGDGDSACCDNKEASGDASCSCAHMVAPRKLRRSASSSTALSSNPSGVSSPSPPTLLASDLGCSSDQVSSGLICVGLRHPTALSGVSDPHAHPHLHPLPEVQQAAPAPAEGHATPLGAVATSEAVTSIPGVSAVGAAANGHRDGGSGRSELMGAFSAVTPDAWAAFQAAMDSATAGAAAAAAGLSGGSAAAAPTTPREQHAMVPTAGATASVARPGSGGPRGGSAGGGGSSGAAFGAGGGSEGAERASPGGSSTSIASLWAAVNSVANAAVYDSTDDSALAGQALSRYRGWSNTTTAVTAPVAAPVVAPSHALEHPHPPHPPHHHHHHQLPPQQHQLETFLAARFSLPHPHQVSSGGGPPLQLPALMTQPVDDDDDDGGGALSPPGSLAAGPVGRTAMSCSAGNGGSNGVFVAARNMLLQECYGQALHLPASRQQRHQYAVATASTTADGYSYSCGDGSAHGGNASGYNRAAEQARSNAHSRLSVDMSYYNPRQPYAAPYQQQLQKQQAAAAAAVTAAAAAAAALQLGNPDSPSRRRGGGTGALQPQPTSYTTYGYRRARSSLAALEQSAAGGVAARAAACSSSDDEEDPEEAATRRITAAFRTHTGGWARNSGWGLLGTDSTPTTPGTEAARRDHWAAVAATVAGGLDSGGSGGVRGGGGGRTPTPVEGVAGAAPGLKDSGGGSGGCEGGAEDEVGEGGLARRRSSYHLTNSHAAVELFLRLNHARQTVDFVNRQTQLFASLDKAQMGVWEALTTLNELREYEAVLMAEAGEAQEVSQLSLLDHAFQTAELCRLHHPDLDWLQLVGLMHGLGKLLAHRRFGSQPQWAICGETFPLGCRFSPHILGSQYFTANPDRRRRLYNTSTGMYEPGCGLLKVVMSWSAPEYLYLVLVRNNAQLPQDALWVLRHAKFLTLTRPNSCYLPLCSGDDLRRLPLLRSFQSLAAYRRVELPEGFELRGAERAAHYSGLIAKYVGEGELLW